MSHHDRWNMRHPEQAPPVAHTPEPWHHGGHSLRRPWADGIFAWGEAEQLNDAGIAHVYGVPTNTTIDDADKINDERCRTGLANARRIVACVNACAGLDPAALPALVAAAGELDEQVFTPSLAEGRMGANAKLIVADFRAALAVVRGAR